MNNMQSPIPSIPLSLISTDQIQKYLDENKNLIIAIMENQNLGKMAECAQYQAVLQKNLMYLAAIADAQPSGAVTPSQPVNDLVAPQGNTQTQTPIMQAGVHKGKLPLQPNTTPNRPQQGQTNQPQQQHHQMQQTNSGLSNNNMRLLMQPGRGNSGMHASSGNGQGKSAKGPMEGRDR